MEDDVQRLDELKTNMAVFSWMSKILDYPDEYLVEALLQDQIPVGIPNEVLDSIQSYFAAFNSPAELLLELQKEYTKMCFVSKPRQVPLFESVYKEGKLFQDSTFRIARLYNEAGLRPGNQFTLPPDHITLELEFMSYLLYQELEAVKTGNTEHEEMAVQLQQETMAQHLAPFGLGVAERLAKHAQTPFYQGVGLMLKDLFMFPCHTQQN